MTTHSGEAARTTRARRSSLTLLERIVLSSFRDASSQTRLELAEQTGLSRSVVTGIVAELLTRGELTADPEPAASLRGRPSTRFRRSSLLPPVVLIHLRKDTHTTIGLRNTESAAERAAAPWTSTWNVWSESIRAGYEDLVGQDTPPRLAVIAAPFPVRDEEGMPAMHPVSAGPQRKAKALPPTVDWLRTDPRPAVAGLLGVPAVMVNDANLAALGEAVYGAGRAHATVLHVSVRDGVGAGLVFDGVLYVGAAGFAGELAHVQVVDNGDFCVCGSRGCLATETRGPRLIAALSDIYDADLDFADIERLAAHENSAARRFLRDLGATIARPLATIITILDPDCLVIDATLGQAAAPLMSGLTAELANRCNPAVLCRLSIVSGILTDAISFGALATANAATPLR